MAITLQKAQTINGTRYDAFTVVTGLSAADEQRLLQGGDALPVDLSGAVSGAGNVVASLSLSAGDNSGALLDAYAQAVDTGAQVIYLPKGDGGTSYSFAAGTMIDIRGVLASIDEAGSNGKNPIARAGGVKLRGAGNQASPLALPYGTTLVFGAGTESASSLLWQAEVSDVKLTGPGFNPVVRTGTVTAGQATITGVNVAGLEVGMWAFCWQHDFEKTNIGVPIGTYISAINGSVVTLSKKVSDGGSPAKPVQGASNWTGTAGLKYWAFVKDSAAMQFGGRLSARSEILQVTKLRDSSITGFVSAMRLDDCTNFRADDNDITACFYVAELWYNIDQFALGKNNHCIGLHQTGDCFGDVVNGSDLITGITIPVSGADATWLKPGAVLSDLTNFTAGIPPETRLIEVVSPTSVRMSAPYAGASGAIQFSAVAGRGVSVGMGVWRPAYNFGIGSPNAVDVLALMNHMECAGEVADGARDITFGTIYLERTYKAARISRHESQGGNGNSRVRFRRMQLSRSASMQGTAVIDVLAGGAATPDIIIDDSHGDGQTRCPILVTRSGGARVAGRFRMTASDLPVAAGIDQIKMGGTAGENPGRQAWALGHGPNATNYWPTFNAVAASVALNLASMRGATFNVTGSYTQSTPDAQGIELGHEVTLQWISGASAATVTLGAFFKKPNGASAPATDDPVVLGANQRASRTYRWDGVTFMLVGSIAPYAVA